MAVKKLIEVALPLEKINAESAREKSIRHGHPSTLHLWWARRPLAAARAVIWASLVDDPSSHPELYPTEEDQTRERERLFRILENLVVWDNSNDERILGMAKEEIKKSMGDSTITLLDPFAGGGTIPVEAQRLGLKAIAHDLNPVAVMINKAMIEIPPRFINHAPVNAEARNRLPSADSTWAGTSGLEEDLMVYGEMVKTLAYKKIGYMYPEVTVPTNLGGGKATVLAWIWTRVEKCPNPACGCNMPLASSFSLSKKKGNEAAIIPHFDREKKKITYSVKSGAGKAPEAGKTARGAKFKCIMCGELAPADYIKEQALSGKMSSEMMAVIAEGRNGRLFISTDEEQRLAANVAAPEELPTEYLADDPRNVWCVGYGLDTYDKLFSNRQLNALVTLGETIHEVQDIVEKDAIAAGFENDHIPLADGGKGALAYAEAITVYLSFAVDRCTDYYSTLATWSGEFVAHTFGRQALPMVWDYAECNPFSNSTGNWMGAVNWICRAINKFPQIADNAEADQFDAQKDCAYRGIMISTDPPYYDNIAYADLSDYFYVWMRKNLKSIYPKLFKTMLVPKAEELVATPYRFDGDMNKAKEFFEDGMLATCKRLYTYASEEIPVTIYYAYKQSEGDEERSQVSTGWETMLSAIINSGFAITGTWPMRTERTVGLKGHTNMLASSIVLVCRKRDANAGVCTRRNFINELKRELRPALKKLQQSNIAPVDMAQSAIGPGMGVYSKYSKVLEADGTPMSVRSALKIINQELDLYFNEQDGELDSESRFCVDLYSQVAFNEMKFGDANTLATAKNTSVAIMASHGTLYAQKGVVHLIERSELPETMHEHEGSIWLLCQQLTYRMEKEGVEGCAKVLVDMFGSVGERAKDLAYRLYTIAEKKHWAQEAYAYNALVVAWPEIQSRAAELKAIQPEQMTIFDY